MNSVFDENELRELERFGFHLGRNQITKTASVSDINLVDCGLGAWIDTKTGKVFTKTASGDLREQLDSETLAEQRYVLRHI